MCLRLFGGPSIERLTGGAKPDIVWSPHLDLVATSTAPRVVTAHDLSFLHYPQFFSSKYHLWSWLQSQSRQAQAAAQIIAASEFTKADLMAQLEIPEEKIAVIYPGINESFKQYSAGDGRLAAYRIERKLHKPFILYLGSLEPRKNLALLIEAFDEFRAQPRFKDYELILAGRDGFGVGQLRRLARKSLSREAIRFLGPVSDEERVLLYNCARVFVFPSWFEGFGFPPLEAQACGLPVVASDRTSLPEILGESALLINPWNSTALAQTLAAIESDSKLRENRVAAGLQNARRFSWRIAADETLSIFKCLKTF